MEELEREYEKVRPQVENGESLVFVHWEDGVVIVCTPNRRPTAMPSGDFVACGLYEKEAILWIQEQEFPVLNNRHARGTNGRTPIAWLPGGPPRTYGRGGDVFARWRYEGSGAEMNTEGQQPWSSSLAAALQWLVLQSSPAAAPLRLRRCCV
jgi:hypothetical protein